MTFMWILLAALILTAITIAVGVMFNCTKTKWFHTTVRIAIPVCAALLIFAFVLGGIYRSNMNDAQTLYDELNIYHELVSECDNEEVRFAHYERVQEYNEMYYDLCACAENSFFGCLMPSDWNETLAPIMFQFHGVNYGYE